MSGATCRDEPGTIAAAAVMVRCRAREESRNSRITSPKHGSMFENFRRSEGFDLASDARFR